MREGYQKARTIVGGRIPAPKMPEPPLKSPPRAS